MKRTLSNRSTLLTAVATVLATGVIGTNCSRGESEQAQPSAAAPAAEPAKAATPATGGGPLPAQPPAAPAAVGTIKGRIVFSGKAPAMPMLKRTQDPFCARTPMRDEQIVVNPNGTLGNVIVRLTNVEGNFEPPATPGEIDQRDCMYRPRVQAIVAGQKILVKNADQTLHNVHTYRGTDTVFNQAQVPGGPAIEREIGEAGAMMKFKCDVHPWMTGYVSVTNHPFFAVTGADGTFTIPNVPAGTRTIESWHERFGTHTADVTVQPNGTAEVTLTYTGTEMPAP